MTQMVQPRAGIGYKMVKMAVDDGEDLNNAIKEVAWFIGLSKKDQELIRKEFK